MNYLTLRVVSVAIRLAAIAAAFFVIVVFMVTIDRQYTTRLNARTLSQQLRQQLQASSAQVQAYNAQMKSLLRQLGVDIDLDAYTPDTISITNPATPEGNDLLRSITLQNIQDLFFGMVASLVIFGFGGIIQLLIDIAQHSNAADYREYVYQQDSELAPSAPKRWADFPPPPGPNRSPIKPPKAVVPRRPGKWDMGRS